VSGRGAGPLRRTVSRPRRVLAAIAAGLVCAATPVGPAQAAPPKRPAAAPVAPSAPDRVAAVPGKAFTPPARRPDPEAATGQPLAARWPAAAALTVDVPAQAGAATRSAGVAVGTLPVRVAPAPAQAANRSAGAPQRVAIAVRDRAATASAGVHGVLMSVRRDDGNPARGTVEFTVDYSAFRHAYGGDWASRLRLVSPDGRVGVATVRNDTAAGTVTAEVSVDAAGGTVALAAAEAGPNGDYKATSLSPAGSWQVSTQGGDFSWTYPMGVPPVPGGLTPEIAPTYSSSAVDGRTAARNSQTSWLGEGWELWPGFIERSYKSCFEDKNGNNGTTDHGDLCWETDNATMSFGGTSGRLLLSGDKWLPEAADGTKVERLFRAGDPTINGDADGEYWRVTTPDGTKYHFGLNRLPGWSGGRATTGSTWTAPVYGNDDGEQCHESTFAASHCMQAYRWNLDYVVDRHGNSMTYYYKPETNRYGQNRAATTATYVRGGTLDRIEYGTRTGREYSGNAPARVSFVVDDRCLPGRNCAEHRPADWPDVPWDTACSAGTCPEHWSPTFWTQKRLSRVTTEISTGNGGYRAVDRWDFAHTYPVEAGDPTGAGALWLNTITRTGMATGSAVPMPAVRFDGSAKPNRVNSAEDGLPGLYKRRLTAITTESGGIIHVNYANVDCTPGTRPVPATNTRRCFPVRWAMPPATQPVDDWFHKYVVSSVVEDDAATDADDMVTTYAYGPGAWAYDDNPLIAEGKRTWWEWRGFEKVTVTSGDPRNDEGRGLSKSEYLYFRGMHGDRTASGGTKMANVVDSAGTPVADREPLAGFLREEIVYDGANVAAGSIHDPWIEHRARAGHLSSDQVETVRTATRTRLANGTYRRTQTDTTYDDYGNPLTVDDRGDTGRTGDERCTTRAYAYDTTAMLVTLPSREQTVGVTCGATPSYPTDAISHTEYTYDDAGNMTAKRVAKSYSGSTPTFLTAERTSYDAFGRVLTAEDALSRDTVTAYVDTHGLNTGFTVTNPLTHGTTTTVDPAWGLVTKTVDANQRAVTRVYDALGRLLRVYEPGRSGAAGDAPSRRYSYGIRNTGGANWIRTETLKPNGNLVPSYELLDGFLRPRQTQSPSPAPDGGRIVVDTHHDTRGLVSATTAPYRLTGAVGTTLMHIDAGSIPSHTVTMYDGAERPTAEIYLEKNAERWRTTTVYNGDSVTVYPPAGGTVTTTHEDARGRVTALWQWHGRTTTGQDYDETRYTYTKRDQLATVTDDAGNVWRYGYDVLGRKVRTDDPDAGVSTMTYDDAGQQLSRTDSRGKTVATVHDPLGRPVETRLGSPTGTLLTRNVYDTLSKGALTSVTRHEGEREYVRSISGYDAAGRPTAESVTIPAAPGEEALADTYTTSFTYKADGSPATTRLPALAGLGAETLTYGYTDLGLPLTTTGAIPYVTGTEYTGYGEVAQLELGPQASRLWQTTYYEEGTRRVGHVLTERERAGGGLMVNDIAYGYDQTGNVTRVTDRTTGSSTDSQCFTYDYLRRVTTAWTQGTETCAASASAPVVGGPAPYWHQYGYDVTGNRRARTVKGLGGAADTVSTYAYPASGDGADRPHAVASVTTGSQAAAYTYDAAGNLLTRPGPSGTQTLTWADNGTLGSVTAGGRTTSYVYDATGSQLIRRDPGAVTLFVGAGEIRLDRATGTLTGTRYYDGLGTRTSAGFMWTISDHHGTSHLAVNSTTLAATVRRTDLFGNPRGAPAAWPAGSRGFVGGVTNPDTGLTRLGAREYDPALGRFISVDPLIDPADPQQMNGYAYANNSPATMSDPDGLIGRAGAAGSGIQKAIEKLKKKNATKKYGAKGAGSAVQSAVNNVNQVNARKQEEERRAAQARLRHQPGLPPGSFLTVAAVGSHVKDEAKALGEKLVRQALEALQGDPSVADVVLDSLLGRGPLKMDSENVKKGLAWVWDHLSTISGILGLCAMIPTGVTQFLCGIPALVTGAISLVRDIDGCISTRSGMACGQAMLGTLTLGIQGVAKGVVHAFGEGAKVAMKGMRTAGEAILLGGGLLMSVKAEFGFDLINELRPAGRMIIPR
jgi:RHS repeat-associated protein